MKKRFTEEQIIGALKEAEAGMKVSELCKINRHGLPNQSHRAACTPFRKSRALTQAQLAMHLGVRQSRVADIEGYPWQSESGEPAQGFCGVGCSCAVA